MLPSDCVKYSYGGYLLQPMALVKLEELTQKQAADRSGLSLPGMKVPVQRGRRQLKMLLEDYCVIELEGRNGVVDCENRHQAPPCCYAGHQHNHPVSISVSESPRLCQIG